MSNKLLEQAEELTGRHFFLGKALNYLCAIEQAGNINGSNLTDVGINALYTEIEFLIAHYDELESLSNKANKKGNEILFGNSRPKIFVRDNGRCRYCQKGLVYENEFHIDHIFPKARGGCSGMANLALACPECNVKKGCRTPEEAGMILL